MHYVRETLEYHDC
jgi:hypothetical protein